jgi:hypothetical protein
VVSLRQRKGTSANLPRTHLATRSSQRASITTFVLLTYRRPPSEARCLRPGWGCGAGRSSPAVILNRATPFSLPRRTLARRVVERDLGAPCASPGSRDPSFSFFGGSDIHSCPESPGVTVFAAPYSSASLRTISVYSWINSCSSPESDFTLMRIVSRANPPGDHTSLESYLKLIVQISPAWIFPMQFVLFTVTVSAKARTSTAVMIISASPSTLSAGPQVRLRSTANVGWASAIGYFVFAALVTSGFEKSFSSSLGFTTTLSMMIFSGGTGTSFIPTAVWATGRTFVSRTNGI